jgi:hypothetical protein
LRILFLFHTPNSSAEIVSGTLLILSSTLTYKSIDNFNINQQPEAFTSCAHTCCISNSIHQSLQKLLCNKRLFINHFEGNHHRCRSTIILSSLYLIALKTVQHTAGLTLLCHSNNLIFVNHHLLLLFKPFHWFIPQSIRP